MSFKITYNNKNHIKSLDGLRGLAVLMIIFFHNFEFIGATKIGWIGVDLFFVLSGFLITRILFNSKNDKNYYKKFMIRRALRILPLYYLTVGLFLVLRFYYDHPLLFSLFDYKWSFLSYTQNFVFFRNDSWNPMTPLNHFWSLCIEEHFYLIWPFFIGFFSKKNILRLSIILIISSKIFTIYWLYNNHSWISVYTFTFTRVEGLIFGSLLAIILNDYKTKIEKLVPYLLTISISVFVLFFIGIEFYHRLEFETLHQKHAIEKSYGLIFTINASIFLCTLIYSLGKNWWSKLLSTSFFTFLGTYSYGIYVYQVPLKELTSHIPLAHSNPIIYGICITLFTILISLMSYHLFEKFFIQLKNKVT